ncbi:hypothetical protein TSOC_010695 [Tetrabaena socialis]|uniref:Uncharacterized protein n=1 Tax=Tetrabaena socialis TaxID=47790 RepID=A0A2J7ZSL4_9CHLO|nr:hypothetical protein TSOC_010695 [Tetrabaena socialis]|eukprot:PNH03261.1 hypothetical protein TSOC_010695 [Tetrabaena socialis]
MALRLRSAPSTAHRSPAPARCRQVKCANTMAIGLPAAHHHHQQPAAGRSYINLEATTADDERVHARVAANVSGPDLAPALPALATVAIATPAHAAPAPWGGLLGGLLGGLRASDPHEGDSGSEAPLSRALVMSGHFRYRLYGSRGSVTYLSFGCYCGSRPGQGSSQSAHLDSSQLLTRPDGSFEIFLTSSPRGTNWLRLPPDASRLVVRQTFLRRASETPATIHIERLPLDPDTHLAPDAGTGSAGVGRAAAAAAAAAGVGASGAASARLVDAAGREVRPPLSAGQVVSGLAGAAAFVSGSVHQFTTWSRAFAGRPNSLVTFEHDVYMSAWADPAIHFFHGYWRLRPGEALLIQQLPTLLFFGSDQTRGPIVRQGVVSSAFILGTLDRAEGFGGIDTKAKWLKL